MSMGSYSDSFIVLRSMEVGVEREREKGGERIEETRIDKVTQDHHPRSSYPTRHINNSDRNKCASKRGRRHHLLRERDILYRRLKKRKRKHQYIREHTRAHKKLMNWKRGNKRKTTEEGCG